MKPANVFKYENRLAKTVVNKGGMTADEAIASAEERVEQVREPTLTDIDRALAEIYDDGERLRASRDEAALKRIYAASNRIIGVAGVFGLGELGEAAYSLCELVSRVQSGARFSWPMLGVHFDGLRLLRHPAAHVEGHRAQVLAGLRQVTASLG